MRKIINATYSTLDGDITNMADWHWPYLDDDATAAAHEQLFTSDALIMGHETYKGFFPAWSSRAGADEFADRMNSIRKYVVSSSLTDPEWENSTVISSDVVAQITALKQQDGANILQYGFGAVTRLLLENGLLDELRLWLHPVLSGKAAPNELLHRDGPQTTFALNGSQALSSGLLILSYTPQPAV